MQLKSTKLKLVLTGGRGSNQEISLFLDGENCSNFTLIQLMIYKFHKNLFLEFIKYSNM